MSAIGTNIAVEAAVRLGTLIESHARDAGRQIGEWLRPWLQEGEILPDFTLVLRLPARMIRHAGDRLRESQQQLDESRSRESEARQRRDDAAAALRRQLVQNRMILSGLYGACRTAVLLGIEGETAHASQHALLLSQAEALLKLLRDPKRLPVPCTASVHPTGAVDTLEPLVVAFREAYSRLDEIHQESAARLEAKTRTWTELEGSFRCVVSILGGWLGLIRRPDLAEKLRLVQRGDKKAGKTKNRSRKEVPM